MMSGFGFGFGLGAPALNKGDSVIYRTTILRDARVMRDTIRMIDNG